MQIPQKVKAFFDHSKTVFIARLYTSAGIAAGVFSYVLPWIEGQDLTPIVARLFDKIPADLRPLAISLALAGTGELFVLLRKWTDQSLEEKAEEAEEPS